MQAYEQQDDEDMDEEAAKSNMFKECCYRTNINDKRIPSMVECYQKLLEEKFTKKTEFFGVSKKIVGGFYDVMSEQEKLVATHDLPKVFPGLPKSCLFSEDTQGVLYKLVNGVFLSEDCLASQGQKKSFEEAFEQTQENAIWWARGEGPALGEIE